MNASRTPSIVLRPDGASIAYHSSAGTSPTVVFLGGYSSDMTGSKALFLERWCGERGQAFLRLDYQGHGASSGEFVDGTLSVWSDDAIGAIDAVTDGPMILVGSSMGGWIMLLAGLHFRDRLAGLIGIAAAPDFSEDLMWDGFSPEQKATLEREGVVFLPSEYDPEPYPVTRAFIEDGRRHLLLKQPIPLSCPTRLLHGLDDTDVPWKTSLRLAEVLDSKDVVVTLVKGGGHRLSEPNELEMIGRAVEELSAMNP